MLAQRFPGSTLGDALRPVPGASHAATVSQPDATARLIVEATAPAHAVA